MLSNIAQRNSMMGLINQASDMETLPIGDSRKRKSRTRTKSVAETLAMWKEYNKKLDASNNSVRPTRNVHAKGSKKGCMKGKGGPENRRSNHRGVRQRTWGKWVAEIREPNGGNRLWLGTFPNAVEAAVAYDEAARAMYGSNARLNLPDYGSCKKESTSASSAYSISCSNSILTNTSFDQTEAGAYKDPIVEINDSEMNFSNVEGESKAHFRVGIDDLEMKCSNEEGESNVQYCKQAMNEVKEEPVEIKKEPEEVAMFNLEQGLLLGEMFDVEELLQSLNSDSFPDQDTNTEWCYNNDHDMAQCSQNIELPANPSDLGIQPQNPDQKPPDMYNGPTGYNNDLDFLLPGRQEDCNFSVDEIGLLNMDANL